MNKVLNIIAGFFRRMFEKDFVIKIISIISAIVIWFIVSINVYPTIDRQIYNVPIVVEMQGTYAEAHNFQVVSQAVTEAVVYITGDRGQIGDLSSDELKIVASAENVINAAEYNLPLEVVCTSGKTFSVTKITSSDGKNQLDYIAVNFDEIITKKISVKPKMDNVHIASGFIGDTDDVVVVPETIEITGPKDAVNDVSEAYIYVEAEEELSSTYEYTSDSPVLYSNDAPISEESGITINKTSFTVHVPILQMQTLSLEVKITNAPESFDTSAFMDKLVFSVGELEVAAPAESIEDRNSLTIGSIDMREVDIGSVFTFSASDFLPDGYQNLSGIDTVTVTAPSEGLYKVAMSIRGSAIEFINAPAQFDYNIITSGFTLYFIGSEESIEQISYIDVVSQIDLINYELEARDYKFPVIFSTPAYDDVWCIGTDGVLSPKAIVTVTLKS